MITSLQARIRILHIASGDLMAGAEAMLLTLCRAQLRRKELSVSVALMNDGPLAAHLRGLGVDVEIHDETFHSPLVLLKSLSEQVRALKPALVHTHRSKENVLGGITAHRFRIPSVRTVHGGIEHNHPYYRLDKRFAQILDNFVGNRYQSQIVAVSSELAQKLAAIYPVSKIATIDNGIDQEQVIELSRAETPEMGDSDLKLAFLGRLVPVKRIDKIIQGINDYKHRFECSVNLFIIGDGPLEQHLKKMTRDFGLENEVSFLGYVENPLPWLRQSDALVLASEHEGLPMCVLEALSLGKPVLAPKLKGLDNILDSTNSEIFDSNEPECIAEAIDRLAGRKHAMNIMLPERNTAAFMEQSYFDIYQEAIDSYK